MGSFQWQSYQRQSNLFIYLLLLTGFFLLLEISFFILCNHSYLTDFSFISYKLQIPPSVLPDILKFIAIQLAIHLSYCLVVWCATCSIERLLKLSDTQAFNVGVMLWILGIITILVANYYFLPNAQISHLIGVVLNLSVVNYLLPGLLLINGIVGLLVLVEMLYFKRLLILFVLGVCALTYFRPETNYAFYGATSNQPNIIIVGVDSVRPDFLNYYGHKINTPFINSFLKKSTVFNDAITPLARTFPSWTSILTGKYPRKNGIRTNLANQQQVDFYYSLPASLQRQGYETFYATDETRFSNIDKNMGFDHVITPPMGLNDFIIGTFNDFPLSNLLINTFIGKWLFPYSYANRPVFFAYNPNSFLQLLKYKLHSTRNKPIFLATHFCLPHHPYLWQDLSSHEHEEVARYEKSIERVDSQLHDFFILLRKRGLLDHAIVVLLSDHGEAFELDGDRVTDKKFFQAKHKQAIPKFYPSSLNKEQVNQSVGHGTDVLGLSQYHSLLAVHLYGGPKQYAGEISGYVSLVQIKPTILTLLNPKLLESNSLSTYILGIDKEIPKQHIFLESDFSPAAIHTVHPETRNVILEGVQLFRLDPQSTRLLVRDEMERMIIESKQYADIYGDWMLALYPQTSKAYIPILVNLKTRQWTNELNSRLAKQSPAHQMLHVLKAFYGI